MNRTGFSQRSGLEANRTQQAFFFASARRESGAFGDKEDPILASQRRREQVTNLIALKKDDLDRQSVSQILYGHAKATQKNLIGVRSLKQTIEIPSKLPTIV